MTIIRNINDKLAIKTSESKRRKVVTLKNINRGTLLLKEEAFASVIKEDFIEDYCDYCYQLRPVNKRLGCCSRCRKAYYCSKECQKKAYKYHKKECFFLKDYPELSISQIRFYLQILLKAKDNDEGKGYLNELIDHYENSNKMELIAKLIKVLTKYEGSLESLMKIFNKINCNALGIFNDTLFSYAGGLFLQSSNINHDCNPNCTSYYKGNTIYIKAARNLKEGEEITISYIPFYDSCRNRQETLRNNYHFTCECSRCLEYKDQLYLDPTEGIKCTTKGCDGYISHVDFNSCPKCNQKLPQKTINEVRNIIRYFDVNPNNMLITLNVPNNIDNQLEWLENLLEKQKQLFHPNNYYIFATLQKLDSIILANDSPLQNNELLKSKKTLYNYEIYRYCQNQSLNPSSYNTYIMYNLLTNALNEIFDYGETHQLTRNKFKKYVEKKLNAIQGSTLFNKLKTEVSVTYNTDSIMHNIVQRTLKGYQNLISICN